jgi:LacI family transcriptional regulator
LVLRFYWGFRGQAGSKAASQPMNNSQTLTLKQIGEMAGVSSATVSRVINNRPSVRSEVRERVQRIISETGYQPNAAARTLAGQRSNIVGLVIPQTAHILFTDPYFPRLIQGITQACQVHDYTLSLFLFHAVEDEAKLSTRILRRQILDGVIVTATQIGDPLVEEMLASEIPFVVIGKDPTEGVSFVDADNAAGAYTATSHLIRLGRKRLATITGPLSNFASVDRLNGYLNALRDRGRPPEERWIANGDYTEAGGFAAMCELLEQKPDAVFVASDAMALGAMRAIQGAGLRIPQDIAVVGFDDLPQSATFTPPLTTIRQPIKRAGVIAFDTLLDVVEHGLEPPRRIILPTELVIRQSCGAARIL